MNSDVKLIIYYLLFSITSILAQDSIIVSLNNGNKWFYHYQKTGSYGEDTRLEIKEIFGDTLLENREYKKILVTSIEQDTTLRIQYWGLDSAQFYFEDLEFMNSYFSTFYDITIQKDTIFWQFWIPHQSEGSYGVYLGTTELWGKLRITQKWEYIYSVFYSQYSQVFVNTAFGLGPIKIFRQLYSNGTIITESNTLIGALIDGILYGDTTVVFVEDENLTLLTKFSLSQNYPNPFNPTTIIKFTIPELRFTTLKVYDVLGNEVATLVNEEKPAGEFEVKFSISNLQLTSGVYFYQLRAGSYVQTKKMILMK
ncbi:T9SS type A sorting domain-containing protein [Bacteroidota bacterium]